MARRRRAGGVGRSPNRTMRARKRPDPSAPAGHLPVPGRTKAKSSGSSSRTPLHAMPAACRTAVLARSLPGVHMNCDVRHPPVLARVLRISPQDPNEDAVAFLQGLVTSDVTAPLPVWAGLLTPQGKVLFDFIVWPSGRDLLIDCEAEAADALAKRLSLYRLRRAIGIARDDHLAVHWRDHFGDGAASDPAAARTRRALDRAGRREGRERRRHLARAPPPPRHHRGPRRTRRGRDALA